MASAATLTIKDQKEFPRKKSELNPSTLARIQRQKLENLISQRVFKSEAVIKVDPKKPVQKIKVLNHARKISENNLNFPPTEPMSHNQTIVETHQLVPTINE